MALPQEWTDILAGRNMNLRLGVVQDESGRPMVTAMTPDGEAVGDMMPLDQVTGQGMPNPYGGASPASTITYDEQSGQFGDAQDPAVTAYLNANYPGMGLVHQNLGTDRFLDPSKVYDTPYGRVTSQANVRAPDPDPWYTPTPLTVFAAWMGPALAAAQAGAAGAAGAGAGLEAGGAAADMFGQGAINLGNYGAATAGAGGVGGALQGGVFPVSGEVGLDASMFDTGGAGADMFGQGAADFGNAGAQAATTGAGTGAFDQFGALNSPTGTGMPGTIQQVAGAGGGSGAITSAINKLLGTSLTDADVSTGARVGTTAAGLLAGSGAAGATDPLPGSDTSGLDAAKARTRSSIAGMFDGQDTRYQGIRDSVLGFQKSNLDRDREEAARKLKFSLLRTGNAGGSLQVDEGSKLGRTYDRGLLDATNLADQAAQSARSSDASTKLDLLGRVDSGLDQDAATASAAEQMRLAGDRATSQGLGTTLGNVFADAGLMFQTDAARRGLTDARKAFQSMFSTVPGSSGGSYTGITGRA